MFISLNPLLQPLRDGGHCSPILQVRKQVSCNNTVSPRSSLDFPFVGESEFDPVVLESPIITGLSWDEC